MKSLLIMSAVFELGAGLALLIIPSLMSSVLLGSPLDTPASITAARVGGTGILSLGLACWFASKDAQSRAATGLVAAMLLYNLGVVAVLAVGGFGSELVGIGFWPTVALHAAMAAWCIVALQRHESVLQIEVTKSR